MMAMVFAEFRRFLTIGKGHYFLKENLTIPFSYCPNLDAKRRLVAVAELVMDVQLINQF
ncbi:MAG: hypothetical protein CM15mV111_050 [uncultured marine virus]|nr:MAG: hypothetical protein CM15mV111_050 [uncultured marine virus]